MSSEGKIVEVKCPKCKDILRIKVDATMLANAVSPPISITHIHGDPRYSVHSTTIWVDKNYDIRAVEASDSTILGRGIEAGLGKPPSTSEGRQLVPLLPDEVEITDKAVGKLKEFLEATGRLSAEIAREFTDAYDQFSKLSEILERKRAAAKPVTLKRIPTGKPQVIGKVVKPARRREGEERLST
nr:hypothetical protein [Candidatus Njordarchaeum guaymaensis]